MIAVELDHNSHTSLYAQLYEYLKGEILSGRIAAGDRLPSIRSIASELGISITTVRSAYDQLMVEGYVSSRHHSGFYAEAGAEAAGDRQPEQIRTQAAGARDEDEGTDRDKTTGENSYDPDSFSFAKWRKCMSSVLSESPELLLTEADRQGEPALRREIAAYLYKSRGVVCTSEQVVIGAGTQQLLSHIARILKLMGISLVCAEDPGYLPARSILSDWGLSISSIPVREDGIEIEKLPVNIRTAVYVSPQNQFPTGAVMPVSRRHQILEWAEANDSIIIEDDYNSELRYSGMPVPALQGFDKGQRVVYLGSFTSTLFPAVRISYMVLPASMAGIYETIRNNYDQTCSKTEQLTLAEFMHRGYYQTNLRKVRNLYARKLQETLSAIRECDEGGQFVAADNTGSGINLILRINTRARVIGGSQDERSDGIDRRVAEMQDVLAQRMISHAARMDLKVRSIDQLSREGRIFLLFYYSQIPLGRIRGLVRDMIDAFRSDMSKGGLTLPSVYEVIRLREGRPMFLPEHYERLEGSLSSIGMAPPFTRTELAGCIESMAEENGIRNHNLKLEVDVSGFSVIYMSPTHYPEAELYRTGVRTGILRGERRNPNVKMMDRELRDAADAAIRRGGLYEVMLVDRRGFITEGSRSNVFFIKGNTIYTPPAGQVLKGVTRRVILGIIGDLAGKMDVKLLEEPVRLEDAAQCDAAFISGTSPGVLPVASMGSAEYDVNDPLLAEIMKRYNELCERV